MGLIWRNTIVFQLRFSCDRGILYLPGESVSLPEVADLWLVTMLRKEFLLHYLASARSAALSYSDRIFALVDTWYAPYPAR